MVYLKQINVENSTPLTHFPKTSWNNLWDIYKGTTALNLKKFFKVSDLIKHHRSMSLFSKCQ